MPELRATIQRGLGALPAELVRSRPRLGLAQMWLAVLGGHMEAAGIALDAAERASADAAEEPFEPSVGRAASLLANILAAIAVGRAWLAVQGGDAEGSAALASQTRSKLGDGEWMLRSVCRVELALADWLGGRLGDAERGFTSTVAALRAAGERGLAVSFCNILSHVQLAQGRLGAALGTCRRPLETAPSPA